MSNWVDVLKELVDDKWASTNKALTLAQIPRLMFAKGVDIKAVLNGRKLLEAIEQEAPMHVRLVRDPQQPLIYGAVPKDAKIAEDEYLATRRASIPRFLRSFWVAFIKSLDAQRRRFWDPAENSFVDVPKGDRPPIAAHEITREYILATPPGDAPDPEKVFERILRWTQDQGLDLSEFTAPKTAVISHAERRSLFDGLGELPDSDLQRIAVPMDIVRKLLTKK